MTKAIHLTQALGMLNRGGSCSLRVVTRSGAVKNYDDVVSLRYDHYKGTRSVKFLRSGQVRSIRDIAIIGIDDFEVYL